MPGAFAANRPAEPANIGAQASVIMQIRARVPKTRRARRWRSSRRWLRAAISGSTCENVRPFEMSSINMSGSQPGISTSQGQRLQTASPDATTAVTENATALAKSTDCSGFPKVLAAVATPAAANVAADARSPTARASAERNKGTCAATRLSVSFTMKRSRRRSAIAKRDRRFWKRVIPMPNEDDDRRKVLKHHDEQARNNEEARRTELERQRREQEARDRERKKPE